MSRSPTTPDKRVGYPDTRPASGWADEYSNSGEGNLGNQILRTAEPQGSARGTGPNPNGSGAVARPVADVSAGRFEDSNGVCQTWNEQQTLDGHGYPTRDPRG